MPRTYDEIAPHYDAAIRPFERWFLARLRASTFQHLPNDALIASARIFRFENVLSDRNVCPGFMIDTESSTRERVLKAIERFTLAGDFRVRDVTDQHAHFTLQGPQAGSFVEKFLQDDSAELRTDGLTQTLWQELEVIVIRSSHTGADGFDLIIKAEHANRLWDALVEAGAVPVGYEALETLRIEAGIPRFGVDMDEGNVVTEAIEDAVSYTKGCYVGQEIIARIKYRGHVAKKLSGLLLDTETKIERGAAIVSPEDKEIGRITSVAFSPRLDRTVALGYVKFDYAAAGTEVRITTGSEPATANVVALPFISDAIHTNQKTEA